MRSISGARRASTARSTTCVRTGTSASSGCTSLMACCEVVMADLVAARLVEAVAAAARLALGLVGRYHLQEPLEALEMRRAVRAKGEQKLAIARRLGAGGDQDRCFGGERIVQRAVRHEADRRPGPEQLVDAARGLGLGRVDEHALFLRQGLAREPAGDLQPIVRIEVEIDRRHRYFFPACLIAKRTSSG